jgi:HEAT repeat protein
MVRLRAAKELGAEGRDVLLALAESKGDDALSAQAVSILGGELPFERSRALLTLALDRRRLQTACACLERLGHSQDTADVETLAKVMASEENELAAAAALALGATGSSTAEPPLILALEQERKDLWVAAATALGRVGSAAAVLPLKEAAERSALNLDLRKAARQAIAEIQSRLSSASPGQLSLAATEAGQLSLAQGEAGQLSLAAGAAPARAEE